MATKIEWQINTLEREVADGYVNKVIYRVNGSDGDYKYRATGEVDLPKPDTLVPYADLTETQILGWIKTKLELDETGSVKKIEDLVKAQIAALKTPSHATGKPWS